MDSTTYRVTFNPASGEGSVKIVVVYIDALGADSAIEEARNILTLKLDLYRAVEAVKAAPQIVPQKT